MHWKWNIFNSRKSGLVIQEKKKKLHKGNAKGGIELPMTSRYGFIASSPFIIKKQDHGIEIDHLKPRTFSTTTFNALVPLLFVFQKEKLQLSSTGDREGWG